MCLSFTFIRLLPADEAFHYIRGDVNVDGQVTLFDVLAIFSHARTEMTLRCEKAADVDDNGKVDRLDAFALVGSIFYRQGLPAAPFLAPGADLTEDSLSCAVGPPEQYPPVPDANIDAPPRDPIVGTDTDCDDDEGGPDLEFIHFRGGVLVSPGETRVRAPIYFSSAGGVEALTLSLYAPPEVIRLDTIEFSATVLGAPLTAPRSLTHTFTGLQDEGFLASTVILSVEDTVRTLPRLYDSLVAHVEFTVSPEAKVGTTTSLVFASIPGEKGFPPIRNAVSRKASAQPRHFCGLSIEIVTGEDVFIRGDANRDRAVNLSDVVTILQYLFAKTAYAGSLPCPDAADLDNNGAIGLSDALGLSNFLFLRGEAPAAPYPMAGRDRDYDAPDGMGCADEN